VGATTAAPLLTWQSSNMFSVRHGRICSGHPRLRALPG